MAERYDNRSMVDQLAGNLPPGTTVDDSGQLIWRDTGEPVKQNPWKLGQLLQILGLAMPVGRAVAPAAPAATAGNTAASDAGMAIANRVAPRIGQTNDTRQAIAGPPPADLPAVGTAPPSPGAATRALPEAAPPAAALTQQSAAPSQAALDILRQRMTQAPGAVPAANAPREVLPPPRVVGGEAAGESAGNWYTPGSVMSQMERSFPEQAANGWRGFNPDQVAAARAAAAQVLGQQGPAPRDGQFHLLPVAPMQTLQRRPPPQATPAPAPQAAPTQQDVPLPPRRPADLTPPPPPQRRGSNDYQSNSRQVVDNGKLNWGSGDSAADFFRASNALRDDPTLSALSRGGAVHPEVAYALSLLRKHGVA